MIGFFDETVLSFISPYFLPLRQHLSLLWDTISPQPKPSIGRDSVHSVVTCNDMIGVFKTILQDQSLITQAEQAATTLGKRSLPGELELSSNGWDVLRPNKKQLKQVPKMKPSPAPRVGKLLSKRSKGV
jgi:hypothetical protein